ncbi:hypothetical protein B0H13DRAFT_1890802 [Mycena leptocephala]|nr:hypothetical protein B0H13DRAFT_1890802 [Mycena leptocephala]
MLPPEPKIFHGRNSELSDILQLFSQGYPGLQSWVQVEWENHSCKAIIHHTEINQRYNQERFFIACDSAATQVELAALIGAHVGLKPGKDLTHPVIQYFSSSSSCLLILDNLETLWEPVESRGKIEEFLSLLTDYNAGAERPAKVAWTHPFLPALKPLEQDAARQTFIDIADSNMIQRRLTSPRLNPHSKDLLSLLSMLPDGLSDVELVQSKLPIDNILGCKAALVGTTLAYSNEHKRLKALVPIREYMQKHQPPGDHLIRPLLKHFQELLEFYMEYRGNESSSSIVARVSSNYSNIENVLQNGLQQDLANSWDKDLFLCFNRFTIVAQLVDFNSISNPDTLASNALEHFEEFDDPELKGRFYNTLAYYYQKKADVSSGTKISKAAISLALSTGNTKMHSEVLHNLHGFNGTLNDVQRNCDRARKMLDTVGDVVGVTMCDTILADLHLREGSSLAEKTMLVRCYKASLEYSGIQTYCLERLGDASCWGGSEQMSSWTTAFLVHALKRKEKLGTYKALQFLGDVFLSQNDEHTATNLFTVALEGFTQMDVHCSRAECMLRFGDISMGHGDLLKAVEFWEAARPLFERSSQAKQVQHIDERVANISKDVLEQHRNNLAHLAELNALAGTVEELEDDLSDIEDLNKVDMGEGKELGLIAV